MLVLAGPTAVGKSAAALKLCQLVRGEIISADSVQIYKSLNVGANKPSEEELNLVPHHMLDIADPSCDEYTAGDFYRAARDTVRDVLHREMLPVVVGGTMMYVRWFVYGRPATPRSDMKAKQKVSEALKSVRGDWDAALALLAQRDPKRAAMLFRNDWYRLGRALEIVETTGTPMTEMPLQGGAPQTHYSGDALDYDFRCVFLYDDRIPLNRRIDERCEDMILPRRDLAQQDDWEQCFEKSMLTEVSELLRCRGLRVSSTSPAFAIGYRQTITYLVARAIAKQGKTVEDDTRADGQETVSSGSNDDVLAFRSFLEGFQSATRGYARAQAKWFRKEMLFHWVKAGASAGDVVANIVQMTESEYKQFREQSEADQLERRQSIVEQGKAMKRYVTKKEWLINDSIAEARAVFLAERCASDLASSKSADDLDNIRRTILCIK